MKERIKELVKNCIQELTEPFYQAATGELAFFLFLSLLPLLTLVFQLLGIFSLSLESIREWITLEIGNVNIEPLIESIPSENLSAGSNLLLVAITAWSASKCQHALTNLTDYINNDYEKFDKGYVKRRARSFLIIFVIIFVFVLALVFIIYFPVLVQLAFGNNRLTSVVQSLYVSLRWIVVMGLYFLTVLLVYVLTPYHMAKVKDVMPGAIFSSIGFIIVTVLYSLKFRYSDNSNIIYGSMAQVVILMIWFWFIAWVMCLGIVLNKNIKNMRESSSGEIPIRSEDVI